MLDSALIVLQDLTIDENNIKRLKDCLHTIRDIRKYEETLEYYSVLISKEIKELCEKHNFDNLQDLETFIKDIVNNNTKTEKTKETKSSDMVL